MNRTSQLLKAIDSVLAPRATPEQEAIAERKLAGLTEEQRQAQYAAWEREYARYRRSVLRSI